MPTYLNRPACEKLKTVVDEVMNTQFDVRDDLRITYNTSHINPDMCRDILNGNYYRLHYPGIVCIVENITVETIIHITSGLEIRVYKQQI